VAAVVSVLRSSCLPTSVLAATGLNHHQDTRDSSPSITVDGTNGTAAETSTTDTSVGTASLVPVLAAVRAATSVHRPAALGVRVSRWLYFPLVRTTGYRRTNGNAGAPGNGASAVKILSLRAAALAVAVITTAQQVRQVG